MANSARNQPGQEPVVAEEVVETPQVLENIQSVYQTNKTRINAVVSIILVAVLGFFVYNKFIVGPNEEKAATAMFYPQRYFGVDSLDKALNGDGQHLGFLKIAKKYSGTKEANLCNYYSGMCYLHMGDSKNAIKYLEQFDAKGTQLGYVANGALGDAYMDAGNTKKGMDSYEKAASNKSDKVITPMYLQRLATAYEMNNKPEDAKKIYKRLKEEYPQNPNSRDAERNLARLGELN
jgi:tetratricopeptide (TPR) repeat protein